MTSPSCPCGSGDPLESCCGPILRGERPAETAEALLRARFTAFARRETDFVVETNHPDQRGADNRETVESWASATQWHSLDIQEVAGGGPEDDAGFIRFVAHYTEKGKEGEHAEEAEFRRKDGRWFFFDGKPPRVKTVVRDQPKIGRNAPCPCGSGKKYKKCCGG
ncbi:MAG: YchJ family protein [Desulfococcaceae bacterium]